MGHTAAVTIRRRRPDDLPACVAALFQVHEQDGYPQVWMPDPTGFLEWPGTLAAWVWAVDGQALGHVSLIDESEGPEGPEGTEGPEGPVKLSRLFVAPAARGQGVARQLMDTALAWADKRGLDIVLEVDAASQAVAVYERMGWQFLTSGTATWTGRNGIHPEVRYYAAPVQHPSPFPSATGPIDQIAEKHSP